MRLLALLSAAALLFVTLVACEEETPIAFRPGCEVTLDRVLPDTSPVAGGIEAAVEGLWLASEEGVRDTVVRVGGNDAKVIEVLRDGCDVCAACSVEAVRCRECESVCRGTAPWVDGDGVEHERQACTERVIFQVPAATAEGRVGISVTSRHGEASGLWFEYDDEPTADDDDSAP